MNIDSILNGGGNALLIGLQIVAEIEEAEQHLAVVGDKVSIPAIHFRVHGKRYKLSGATLELEVS